MREMFPKASKIKVSTAGFAECEVKSVHGKSTSLGKKARPADPHDASRMNMANYGLNVLN